MNKSELIERLKGYEWNDIEFKKALNACPKSAYETVSAFANTFGGWLVFGVKEENDEFEIIGVQKVNKVETEFLSTLHSTSKISCQIEVEENTIKDGSSTILTFFIPEAKREDKPVYLNGDIRRSFIRRGSGDHKCTDAEIKTFLREASKDAYDTELIDIDFRNCFDDDSIQWYRYAWQALNPGKLETASNIDFLKYYSMLREDEGKIFPIRAAVLLFGNDTAVMRVLPRPVVDFRRINMNFNEIPPDKRWDGRDVVESNLTVAWRRILEIYMKISDVPFRLDPDTLARNDKPVHYIAFREAVINLLTHQDYGEHFKKASIQIYKDRMIFWNPGASFVSKEEMFVPGERTIRNPQIVNMFRRIGLSEQAGTGINAIYSNWRSLRLVPPVIENNKSENNFCLKLLNQDLVSEAQFMFQSKLGVHLNEEEAAVFAQVWRNGHVSPLEARAVSGLSIADTDALIKHLLTQNLIDIKKGYKQTSYVLAEHLNEIKTVKHEKEKSLVSDQAIDNEKSLVSDQALNLEKLSEAQLKTIGFSEFSHTLTQILDHSGLKSRTYFRRNHLEPLIQGGILKMTYPDQPKHPNQAYVLTKPGFDLKARIQKKLKK